MKNLIACAVAITVLAGLSSAAQQRDPELDMLFDQYQTAFNKGNAKALASLYADDAIRLAADNPPVTGQAAILQMFEKQFAGEWKGTKLSITRGRAQSVAANVRLEEGTFEVTGGKEGPQRGRYLITLVRRGVPWNIAGLAAIPATPAK